MEFFEEFLKNYWRILNKNFKNFFEKILRNFFLQKFLKKLLINFEENFKKINCKKILINIFSNLKKNFKGSLKKKVMEFFKNIWINLLKKNLRI